MNNREEMQKAFEVCERYAGRDFTKINGLYADDGVQHEFKHFSEGFKACLESQAQQPVYQWVKGYPTNSQYEEWFIAKTIHKDRIVLRRLPEDYSYDFTTADGTYCKKEIIKEWMQFPDSAYLPF